MHKKLLLNVGLFLPLSITASNAPSGGQEHSSEVNINRQVETLTQEITQLKKYVAINEHLQTKKIEALQDALSAVTYEMALQLKPYEIIGAVKAFYAVDRSNAHVKKAYDALINGGFDLTLIVNYPSIKEICASSAKLIALSQAKALLHVYMNL